MIRYVHLERQNPLSRDRRRPEGFVEPMLATPVQRVPTGPEWQFEVKHDGYRMIARAESGKARIWSRWGLNWTPSFPSVAGSLRSLPFFSIVPDLELAVPVVLGSNGVHRGSYTDQAQGQKSES